MHAESSGRRIGRWAVALVTVVLAVVGFVAVAGFAYAGDPDNVGAPGEDGEDVTCTAYMPPTNAPICNVVGEDGADGGTGTDS